jgi:hypothetical protein
LIRRYGLRKHIRSYAKHCALQSLRYYRHGFVIDSVYKCLQLLLGNCRRATRCTAGRAEAEEEAGGACRVMSSNVASTLTFVGSINNVSSGQVASRQPASPRSRGRRDVNLGVQLNGARYSGPLFHSTLDCYPLVFLSRSHCRYMFIGLPSCAQNDEIDAKQIVRHLAA